MLRAGPQRPCSFLEKREKEGGAVTPRLTIYVQMFNQPTRKTSFPIFFEPSLVMQ